MEIRLEKLSKKFDTVGAVKNLSITIDDGELVSILGPSGCGKSTTLFLIAGLHKLSSGNIFFGNIKVNDIEAEDREIGMVFQSYALYPHMTVLKNIMFPLKMKKVPKKEAEVQAKEIAKLMHIDELLNRKPSQLSGGQQQRVAIARALVKKPKILLLDEPLSNLDARLRIELRDEIRRIQKQVGITTIFVTHDQEEAMSISDKILLMKDGECQQFATPKEMYMNPANEFVARFLGNPPINLLKGNYIDDTNSVQIQDANVILDIGKYTSNLNKSNAQVTIGIRPEDLFIAEKAYSFIGSIVSLQTLGKEIYVKTKVGKWELVMVTPWDLDLKIGDSIALGIKKLHIF
ncbi:ABC transporter ATP-binding protein [Proteiniborus sp. MB09-C3]|uniref:ABC transporter ATP-binding protein n=1 Tax=Proteiniborus sp. MB09-C3 TaxID=3050072 RepID=UPI002557474F|nr:ABC transporter ATP-binding protein [Proteiniborus sp. MB09-C3]WIV11289.1 ABC transporter ATP-binding protein [Proteiniborus sp. MB09-C3]